MKITQKEVLYTDILIIGGGTAGCYAAMTIREHSDYSVVIAEKANIKRSGCLAAGVNALNAYIVKKAAGLRGLCEEGCGQHCA